jgi:uncharacterized protein DUF4382
MSSARSRIIAAAGMALAATFAAACGSDSTQPGTGQLSVRLADASCGDIATATVWISQVYLIGGEDTTGAHFVITDQDQSYDLLTLQGGVSALLGTATIPTGSYEQMRLVVDSAQITLVPGLTFASGDTSASLRTPSAQQSGIKVNFSSPLTITQGQTVLVADFDVCQSFVFTGPSAAPTGVLFKPVIHAIVTDVAGSISGTVAPDTARATVYGILNGDTVATATADTLTGAYTLPWLVPGTYDVGAKAAGFQSATVTGVVVGNAQHVTGVDFTLVP